MTAAPGRQQAGDATLIDPWGSNTLFGRDEASFERLVLRHGPMVLRVCRDILGDHAAADDAFQATFLVLFRRVQSIRDRDAVGRWLYEVACRVSRRARAVASKRRAQERRALMMTAVGTPDHELLDREWRPILHEEIHALPEKFREALLLCYFEGLTVEAAARQLDCPTGTLKSRLTKGRELLRARLTRRGLAAAVIFCLLLAIEQPVDAASPVVAPSLVRSTVRAAFGDPTPEAGLVETTAGPERSIRSTSLSRTGLVLILLLVIFGGTRWSLAAWSDPNGASSLVANLGWPSPSNVVYWLHLPWGNSSPAHHCRIDR